MKDDQSFQSMLRDFFTIYTFINLGALVFLRVFSIRMIDTALFWQMLLVALLTTLAGFIYRSRRELSKRALLLRLTLHFLVINAIVILSAYAFHWIEFSDTRLVIAFVVLTALVYALISAAIHFASKQQIKRLNEKLNEYQQKKDEIDA